MNKLSLEKGNIAICTIEKYSFEMINTHGITMVVLLTEPELK
jgi:hypothetical protein